MSRGCQPPSKRVNKPAPLAARQWGHIAIAKHGPQARHSGLQPALKTQVGTNSQQIPRPYHKGPKMRPEDKLITKFTSHIAQVLPKGSYLLQPIETWQTGVHDAFFCFSSRTRAEAHDALTSWATWLEFKTHDYNVSPEQLNWARALWRAGFPSYILTYEAPFSANTEITQGAKFEQDTEITQGAKFAPIQLANQFGFVEMLSGSGMTLVEFDFTMADYSSLGRYLKTKKRPPDGGL